MAVSHLLAERMRPKTLADIIGQEHITAPGSLLFQALQQKKLPSIILWGPPGVGKTTLALALAHEAGMLFFQLSAISSGVKEIREVIDAAKKHGNALLFIDEIHRFNKGQQDALLGAVEKGIITLVGATTENPSFEVNSALLSRCQVFVLKSLDEEKLVSLLKRALQTDTWLMDHRVRLDETEALTRMSGGDARKLLNLLEMAVQFATGSKGQDEQTIITDDVVMQAAQSRVALYDKKGEQHYDIISAFIKSIRGSDPNGAVYWLARMLEGGEDIEFIARRLVILASEDIGNANPTALVMANTCFEAVRKIGNPESRIILSQCTVYLASSPKSNASYMAIEEAIALVREHGDLPVPFHIRNAPTGLMKKLGYGKDYQYSHLGEGNFLEQEYLPEKITDTKLYDPGNNPREDELRKFLKQRWKEKYGY
ncbi:MAG: replication-associated recombination protein A [Chitinophagaceae bacterium]|jgi:putative ATPase|nr:replication-associated recombination protein A [Chitinophagaceae bacterium]